MKFETTYKLENFILNANWEDLPSEVKIRLKGCFLDLIGAMVVGSKSEQFAVGLKLAQKIYPKGDIPVIGSKETFGFMGASCAMGHSSNAYDIDDGHNIIRAHPGTSFVGAILSAACEKEKDLKEFLTALLVAYETSIRSGAAIIDYYNYAHSSGTFGAIGVAAGVGKIYNFTKEQLNNVLSVAEFNAPLVPGIRSVEYPSMNKDGVPFGVMIGALAVMETLCGFEGNKNLLEADEYKYYLDDLETKYQIMDLYFKPYMCCRWAHPAIDACIGLLEEHSISYKDIEKVNIYTFHRATLLSKIVPKTVDEAQYNISFPVASALIYKDFSFMQVRKESLQEEEVIKMMDKLSFITDQNLDAKFPEHRICKAEIITKDGKSFISKECEPRGEAKENISFDWLCEKFSRITAPLLTRKGQTAIIDLVNNGENISIREIINEINNPKYWKM